MLVLEPAHRRGDLSPIVLATPRTTIGSSSDCEVRLALGGIEPRHCTVLVADGRTTLESHAQRTWLNNAPVRRAVLRAGDRLAIGPWEFRVRQATTEELLHHLPTRPAIAKPETQRSEASPANPLDTLKALEQELRRELTETSPLPVTNVLDDVELPTGPPPLPEHLPETDHEAAQSDESSSAITLESDRERLGSLLSNWDSEAGTLRRDLLAQAESLNSEIRRQQQELQDLQEQTRRSARQIAQEQQASRELFESRGRDEEIATELQRREQDLAIRNAALEAASRALAEERAQQELTWREQQAELGATAKWWEQRRADYGRRQAHLAAVSDLLLESERELLNTARQQQVEHEQRLAELTRRREERVAELADKEQHLSEWEQSLKAQDGLSTARLAEVERAVANRAVRDLEFQERERGLSDRLAATVAREERLASHERELETVAADLDRREQELESLLASFRSQHEEQQSAISERETHWGARATELAAREQSIDRERVRLNIERRELDEEVARLHQLRRQIEIEREQFDSERADLAEEQARFRDECGRYLEAVETLEEQQRKLAREKSAIPDPAVLPAVDPQAERQIAEQEALQALQQELERSQVQIEAERSRLAELEASLNEQTDSLQGERESLLNERLAWERERQLIDEQRKLAATDQAELAAERDRMQTVLDDLEANRSHLGEELDRLRSEQAELNSHREHRHVEVADWLQEHADTTGEGAPRAPSESEPVSDAPSPQPQSPRRSVYDERAENEFRRPPVDEGRSYGWSHGLNDLLGDRHPEENLESEIEDLRDRGEEPLKHADHLRGHEPLPEDAPAVLGAEQVEPDQGHVRSLLAEMFNLPNRTAGHSQEERIEEQGSGRAFDQAGDVSPHDSGYPSKPTDWPEQENREEELFRRAEEEQKRTGLNSGIEVPSGLQMPSLEGLSSLQQDLAREQEASLPDQPMAYEPPPAPPAPPSPAPADYHLQDADPDSIADYMQRLLQRNRRRGQEDYEPTAAVYSPAPEPQRHVQPAPMAHSSEMESGSELQDPQVHTSAEIENEPDLPVRTRADAQEVRAGIDSLRHVANLSARTAVASHSWKRDRSLIFLRALLMLAAFAVAGVLLIGPLSPEGRFANQGYAALFIAIVAGADFARTTWRIYSLNSLRKTSERDVASGLGPE